MALTHVGAMALTHVGATGLTHVGATGLTRVSAVRRPLRLRRVRHPEAAPRRASVTARADDVLGPMLRVSEAVSADVRGLGVVLRCRVEELVLVGPEYLQDPSVGMPSGPGTIHHP